MEKLYRHERMKNKRTTPFESSYKTECDVCMFARNRKGKDFTDENMSPKVVFCKYEKCPFEKYYSERLKHKAMSVDEDLKKLLGGE